MSKGKKDLIPGASDQGCLFDQEITEGALDVSLDFRHKLSTAISRCKQSRWQIAALMSELTRRNITKDMLDKYTSSNLDYALRAEDLPAVLFITRTFEPARALIEPVGGEVIDPHESKLVKLARLERDNQKLQSEITRLRHELGMR